MSFPSLLKTALFLPIAAPIAYVALIFTLTVPWIQRHVIYAHKLYPGGSYTGENIEKFGFGRGQVTAFNVPTPDDEILLAWHILPLNVYANHRHELDDARTTTPRPGLDLLRNNQEAKVVIYFHGVAGHISEGWRTYAYRSFSDLPNVHVLALDYRGYGSSTGVPDEAGLITDGIAFLDYIMHNLGIPASNIIIQGQSLGTAVASAVALHYADTDARSPDAVSASKSESDFSNSKESRLLPPRPASERIIKSPTIFAGVLLVAPFASFPDLLLTYRIKGIIPLLRPLRSFPNIQSLLTTHIPDTWRSADRLAAYYRSLSAHPDFVSAQKDESRAGSLVLIHAMNDPEIPVVQVGMIVKRVTGMDVDVGDVGPVADIARPNAPRVAVEIVKNGGHSRIVISAQIQLAILDIIKQKQ